jgi:hypothetical protein
VARELVAFCPDEALSDDPDRLAAVAAHLDGSHRHQQAAGRDDLSEAQRALDDVVLGLSGPHQPFALPALGPETPNLQLAFDEAERLSWFVTETDRLTVHLEDRDRQIEALHAEIEARSAQASELAEQVMALRAQADDWERQLIELRSKLPLRAYARLKGLLGR